jgi:hypothetical protein
MNVGKQTEVFVNTINKMQKILLSKGEDYANEDVLSNFKLAAGIVGTTPELNCLNLIATKVARLGVLLNKDNVTPNNESIDDSLIDLANYTMLLIMIREDNN